MQASDRLRTSPVMIALLVGMCVGVLTRQVFLFASSVLCVVYSCGRAVHGAANPAEKGAAGTDTMVHEQDFYFDSSSFLHDVIGTLVLATVVTALLTLFLKDQEDEHATPKHVPVLPPVDEGNEQASDSGDEVRHDIEAEWLGRAEIIKGESLQQLRTAEEVEAPSYSDIAPAQESEEAAAEDVLVDDVGTVEEQAREPRADDGPATCSPAVTRDFARYLQDLKEQTRSEMQETAERLNKMSACQAQVLTLTSASMLCND